MDLPLALHTAARRFCARQHEHWSAEYMRLEEAREARIEVQGASPGWDYSKAAYGLFPKYRLDQAIETEVERFTGRDFHSLEEARKLLLGAGRHALPSLIREFQSSREACAALNDELNEFSRYIGDLEAAQLHRVEPLPYRRVLEDSESKRLWNDLRARWGVENSYWYPLSKCPPHSNIIAFHQELWKQRDGTSLLFVAVQERNIDRCLLLRESPPDYEIDRSLIKPVYDGSESFVTSDFDWLLYISHESSITVAGWLADLLRAQWTDWESVTYGGPFHTSDLRGSWETPS